MMIHYKQDHGMSTIMGAASRRWRTGGASNFYQNQYRPYSEWEDINSNDGSGDTD